MTSTPSVPETVEEWEYRCAEHPGLAHWFARSQNGLSACAIVAHCTGLLDPDSNKNVPHDMGDFIRCQRLLRAVPTLQPLFHEAMPRVSPLWSSMVAEWDSIVAEFEVSPWDRPPERPDLSRKIKHIIDTTNQQEAPNEHH